MLRSALPRCRAGLALIFAPYVGFLAWLIWLVRRRTDFYVAHREVLVVVNAVVCNIMVRNAGEGGGSRPDERCFRTAALPCAARSTAPRLPCAHAAHAELSSRLPAGAPSPARAHTHTHSPAQDKAARTTLWATGARRGVWRACWC